MTSNATIIRNAYKALLSNDVEAVKDLLSDDVVWHTRGWGPFTGDYRGKDAVLELLSKFSALTEGSTQTEVESFLEDGNRIVTVMSTRQEKPHVHESKHVDIWDMRDGKLVEYWGIQADQQAGALAFD